MSVCYCHGGPNCCIRFNYPNNIRGPYKCPECGAWWAGLEHRCRPSEVRVDINTTNDSDSTIDPNGISKTLEHALINEKMRG